MFETKKQYENGEEFYQIELEHHFIDYILRDSDTLFVTFEPMNVNSDGYEFWQRYPWAWKFLRDQNFSQIGVKVKRVDWYRSADLHQFFRNEDFLSLLKQYKKVVFYGASMGAFAALVFSSVLDGAIVLASSPQSTLDEEKLGWQSNYKHGNKRDWSGDFSDAAECVKAQKKIYILYDPFDKVDRFQALRVKGKQVTYLKLPLLGHNLLTELKKMELLKKTILSVCDETLEDWFYSAIRVRKQSNIYQSNINFWIAYRLGWQQKFQEAIPYVKKSLELNIRNHNALQMAKRLQEILG